MGKLAALNRLSSSILLFAVWLQPPRPWPISMPIGDECPASHRRVRVATAVPEEMEAFLKNCWPETIGLKTICLKTIGLDMSGLTLLARTWRDVGSKGLI
ncbi:hypothetical protein B5K06_21190 [Rhizobium grahamii]|uniref:Uncharacterized protein n=1 Tax=Rhizobium grahamii TaxID=1120045 RepID=A0A370KLI2_9HYPH|nr:hypothetical protein B5K06_21190 [Rhizobium grahamii]